MEIKNFKVIAVFVFLFVLAMQTNAYRGDDWVRVRNGTIPGDAVLGGQERNGQETHVCRARHSGSYYSGRLEGDRCYFNPNNREISARRFEVLTGKYTWRRKSSSRYTVISGSNDFENFYVCRVSTAGGIYPGRTEDGRCFYTRQNRGYSSSRYEILEGKTPFVTIVEAASRGNYRDLQEALQNGQAINLRDSYGKTALMIASEKGYDRLVRELLYERATVDLIDKNGNTALMLAARNGRDTIVDLLLRENANLNARNKDGDTAFTLAASGGHTRIVDDFLRDNTFDKIPFDDIERGFRNAAFAGHTEVLQSLLRFGVNIESPDIYGKTALMNAAAGGRVNAVRFLLDNDADINARDSRYSWTPFLYAVDSDSENLLRFFFEEKEYLRADDKDAEKGLHIAAAKNRKKSVKYLLLKGVDVNSRDAANGNTALMLAAENGHKEMTEDLVKSNADLNAQNDSGQTALMLAAANSKNNTTKQLIKAGADLNIRDNNGLTALGWAIRNKHKDTGKTLKKAKAKQ